MTNRFIIVDDDGTPNAMVDMAVVNDLGVKLAFRLATAADEVAVNDEAARVLNEVGPAMFGYVAASALTTMASEILHPALEVAAAAGADIRPGLAAIADGRSPLDGVTP